MQFDSFSVSQMSEKQLNAMVEVLQKERASRLFGDMKSPLDSPKNTEKVLRNETAGGYGLIGRRLCANSANAS